MSLINDVLKDLERRDAPEAKATPRAVERRRRAAATPAWKWPLWVLAALAVGLTLHLSLSQRDSAPPASQDSGPLTAQADVPAEPEPVSAGHGHTPAVASIDPDATAAHSADSSQPANEPAVQAIQAQSPEQQQDTAEAKAEAAKGASQTQPNPAAAAARENAAASETRPDPEPAPTTQPDRPGPEPTRLASQSEEPSISIRHSGPSNGEDDPLTAAKRLVARGQFGRAESRLRQLIDEQPALAEAPELLATIHVRRGRPDSAIRVLEDGLAQVQNPADLAAPLARLLMEHDKPARARSVLQAHAPPVVDVPDYHLLLAAAHRQAGDHDAAAGHYRKIADALPRRGAAWIGLGVSLESLERPEEAVEAYNRALEGDDARAARFARQRLNALEPITGEPQ